MGHVQGPEDTGLIESARSPVTAVLDRLGSSTAGLTADEAARRLARFGPNAIRSHGVLPRLLQERLQIRRDIREGRYLAVERWHDDGAVVTLHHRKRLKLDANGNSPTRFL